MLRIMMLLGIALTPTPILAQAPGSQPSPTSQPSSQPSSQPAAQNAFAAPIARAHGAAVYASKAAVQADIELTFGGKPRLKGTMRFDRALSKSRIETHDGVIMVFDGEKAWISPKENPRKKVRFALLTWPYFMVAPFKLADPGVKIAEAGQMPLMAGGAPQSVLKMTFAAGIGDTPDDWYILYTDDKKQMKAMSYIVTYGTKAEKAESEPHAIQYHDFTTVDGVVFATRWTFHHWSERQGVHGAPLGEARLSNISFVPANIQDFTAPERSREDTLPPQK
ncbi:MAG: hypothetical protein ACE366_26780 [Bradymonadia bacterium]